MRKILLMISSLLLSGCLGMPESVKPVEGFNLERYLGKWYEIARLNHPFERGLTQVTANYSLKNNGDVLVVNRGLSATDNQWKESKGKAKFVNSASEGYLKVSFFGPFYGSYVIFDLEEENYQYAFVSGPNTDYLWLLSRTPTVAPKVLEKFKTMSKERGFNVNDIIYVRHDG